MEPLLEIENLTVRTRTTSRCLLDGVSLQVAPGEVCSSNFCGKMAAIPAGVRI